MKRPLTPAERRAAALEVWQLPDGSWTWYVLRRYSRSAAGDEKPFARWFCDVVSPFVPEGELGDVYVREIRSRARRIR